MKKVKLYIGTLLGATMLAFSGCEPNMDYANPMAESDVNYYNTKEHLTYAVNGAYNILPVSYTHLTLPTNSLV